MRDRQSRSLASGKSGGEPDKDSPGQQFAFDQRTGHRCDVRNKSASSRRLLDEYTDRRIGLLQGKIDRVPLLHGRRYYIHDISLPVRRSKQRELVTRTGRLWRVLILPSFSSPFLLVVYLVLSHCGSRTPPGSAGVFGNPNRGWRCAYPRLMALNPPGSIRTANIPFLRTDCRNCASLSRPTALRTGGGDVKFSLLAQLI